MKNKPTQQELCERTVQDIGATIKSALPVGVGATLIVFTYGDDDDGGFMAYVSTAERTGMIKTLRELAAKLEREIAPGGAS